MGCFSCPLPDSNLGWIRAAFFLNIPWVLILCIYLIRKVRAKEIPPFKDFYMALNIYLSCFAFYLLNVGVYFEVGELNIIQTTLKNATVIDSLPCSVFYYETAFRFRLSQYCLLIILLLPYVFLCFALLWMYLENFVKQRWNQLTSFIVNRWRYLTI